MIRSDPPAGPVPAARRLENPTTTRSASHSPGIHTRYVRRNWNRESAGLGRSGSKLDRYCSAGTIPVAALFTVAFARASARTRLPLRVNPVGETFTDSSMRSPAT